MYFANSVEMTNKYLDIQYVVACMTFEAYYVAQHGGSDPRLGEKLRKTMQMYEQFFVSEGVSEIDDLARQLPEARRAIVHNKGHKFGDDGYRYLLSLKWVLEALMQLQMLAHVGLDLDALEPNGNALLMRKLYDHRDLKPVMPS